ncbi:hypothetical protein [Sphingorhabdus sp. EL138]|nr:hypothetical protein [Sphingorhabdus sp. EL138]
MLAATLPRDAWTHEAHLAAYSWLLRDKPTSIFSARYRRLFRRTTSPAAA